MPLEGHHNPPPEGIFRVSELAVDVRVSPFSVNLLSGYLFFGWSLKWNFVTAFQRVVLNV